MPFSCEGTQYHAPDFGRHIDCFTAVVRHREEGGVAARVLVGAARQPKGLVSKLPR